MAKSFLRSCMKSVAERGKLLAVFNALYFCSIFVAAWVASVLFVPPPYEGWSPEILRTFLNGNSLFMVVGIFLSNLVLSAFVVVTLPGLVFFPLSSVTMVLRAILWGLLIYPLPSWAFIVALPTLILEGEAYVLAAVAGTTWGMSWLKPSWIYKGEKISRFDALKMASKECQHLYFFVILLLFVGAVVETLTITTLHSFA